MTSPDVSLLSANIGVSVEDVASLPSLDVAAERKIERLALKVGEHLFNFMQSFCGVDGSKLVVLPMDIMDRWFKKFQERAKRDPVIVFELQVMYRDHWRPAGKPPSLNQFRLDVDAGFDEHKKKFNVGVVVRDSQGRAKEGRLTTLEIPDRLYSSWQSWILLHTWDRVAHACTGDANSYGFGHLCFSLLHGTIGE